MTNLKEAKAQSIYWLAKNIGERLLEKKLPPFNLEEKFSEDPLNQIASQSYQRYKESEDTQRKALAAIDLSQQLINASRFRQARHFLREVPQLASKLPDEIAWYLAARRHEKLGWIADYETGYLEARTRFATVKTLLQRTPKENWNDDQTSLNSTATHFSARARLGLAFQGIRPRQNIALARAGFLEDLSHFQQLRASGDPRPFNEGFQYAWLAVGSIKEKEMKRAAAEIDTTEQLFDEGLQDHPESGIKAHVYLLRGVWHLQQGQYTQARNQLSESVRIRTEVEPYPLGKAFSEMGLAHSYFKEGQLPFGIQHLRNAIKSQPGVILYAANGRSLG